jgi:hypothetical protein
MKSRRTTYFFIGIALILFNILIDIAERGKIKHEVKDAAYNFGYFIGNHILAIIGFFLVLAACRVHLKIKRAARTEMDTAVKEMGKP